MSDIANMLREAATYVGPCGDTELVEKLLAAAESLGEPVVTIGADNDLVWASPYTFLAAGTKLYLAPQPAVPEWKGPYTNNGGSTSVTDYRRGWNACRDAMLAAAGDSHHE